ncbi:hypothetical protein LTR85_006883 [Meristemomyces frigidus]|nr:hypothetical protein LTR85_006883 [Meristemomyces frigidus]
MKLTFLLTALTAGTAFAAAESDLEKCQKKDSHAVSAINTFCLNSNIVVPGNCATKGFHIGTGGPKDTTVYIVGNCSPGQWVPRDICVRQLMNMCATSPGGSHGDSAQNFGRNGCQQWFINVKGAYK